LNINRSNPDLSPVSFGRYVKAIREQKGIDLKTVSEALKVSVNKLTHIEAEDHEQLPDEIYVKGILRSYAGYIGIDPDDLIDRYEINRSAYMPRANAFATQAQQRNKMLLRMFFPLLLLAAIGGISIGLFYHWDVFQAAEPADERPAMSHQPETTTAEPGNKTPGKLVLVIETIEKTWIKINIDGEEPLEYLLRPKDHVELEADSRIKMLIGNAGGLEMRLNGVPVDVPGKSGEVVSLELSKPSENENRTSNAE